MKTLALVRDLLDKRLQDRNGRFIGAVDTIVLELGAHGPPTVAAIEVGAPALLRRIHPRLARWARKLPVTRIPLSALREIGPDVEVDVDAEHHATLLRIERWLRDHVVEYLPGSGR